MSAARFIPFIGIAAFILIGHMAGFRSHAMRVSILFILAADALAVFFLNRKDQASPIHKGLGLFILLFAVSLWLWPDGAGRLLGKAPAAGVYLVLFLVAALPPLLGREPFTMYFARKTTPRAVWHTDVFLKINHHLTWFWAVLFFICAVLGLAPAIMRLSAPLALICFEAVLPLVLMLGLGLPITRKYPGHYQRKLGLRPLSQKEEGPPEKKTLAKAASPGTRPGLAKTCKELLQMMPLGFKADAAEGLNAVYQFEMSGKEDFVAHLIIAEGTCTYQDGPAEDPNVIIRTPADIWLAIATRDLDGQQAFMAGKYTVEGDLGLLLKLKSLFSRS